MRKSVLLLSLPVAWLACFSNSSGGGGGGASFDASTDSPEFDSTAPDVEQEAGPDVLMEAANETSPPVDSGVDVAPEAEAGPSPVVVTVGGALGLESGVTIVWGDATGAVVASSKTNAAGMTSQLVAPGSMLTAVLGTPASPSLYTITGIEPGDNLVIIDRQSVGALPGAPGNINTNLTAVPMPLPGMATGLTFYAGPCNNSFQVPPSGPLRLGPPCIGVGPVGASFGAAYPALVEANDSSFNLQGFTFKKNNGLTMPDEAGWLDLDLSGNTWSTSTTEQTVAVTNEQDAGIYTPWTLYQEAANGVLLPLQARQPADGGMLPAGSTLYSTHPGYADFVQTEVGYNPDSMGFVQEAFSMATRGPAPTKDGATTIDWTPLTTLPSLTNIVVDASTVVRPKWTWTTASGTLASSTAVMVYAQWNGTDADGGFQNGEWTIVAAGTAQSSLQAPALPAPQTPWLPVAGSSFGSFSTVYAIQGDTALPTYGQFRPAAPLFTLQSSCIFGPLVPPLPAAGTIRVTGYTSGGCG
jgi:hypothetical protein